MLNKLKNRGLEDVLIFSVDGLTGLKEAIEAAYHKAEIQRCIIHQLRNFFKYVSYEDTREFVKDFRTVYTTVNEKQALDNLFKIKDGIISIPLPLRVGKQIRIYYLHFSSFLRISEELCIPLI